MRLARLRGDAGTEIHRDAGRESRWAGFELDHAGAFA
jgi:hypothetical protein